MKKIPVGILGATGMVGQKFVEMLSSHPWFEISSLAASDRSATKLYKNAMKWSMTTPLQKNIGEMEVLPCEPNLPCKIVFSGLDSSVAGEIEESFAKAGYTVISNSRNHRMDPAVPLIIPEINADHLQLIFQQDFGKGAIVTNPNCSVIGLAMALKPLIDHWGIEAAHVVTLQALSGAGYPGVPSIDILDNVIPFIGGEEDKVETEPLKILGTFHKNKIVPYPIKLSAQCTRVSVSDGHLACVSVKLKKKAHFNDILKAWDSFKSEPQILKLPTAPPQPVVYLEDERHPQPKLHRNTFNGMAVSVGRLRECPLYDWKFVVLSHNTIRGAAGCAILIAELMYKQGYFDGK
ncbi:MAG: aspartate-semialdehyde dehydrogenase [Parachlamydiales bacterium]|jgi:aspartate-semialdehyde dehydrogenase